MNFHVSAQVPTVGLGPEREGYTHEQRGGEQRKAVLFSWSKADVGRPGNVKDVGGHSEGKMQKKARRSSSQPGCPRAFGRWAGPDEWAGPVLSAPRGMPGAPPPTWRLTDSWLPSGRGGSCSSGRRQRRWRRGRGLRGQGWEDGSSDLLGRSCTG